MNEIKNITEQASMEHFSSMTDSIVIFYKELCPHCKNMEKVLIKFGAKAPQVELCSVDSEASAELMAKLDFERVPTLVFIKDGEIVKTQSGLMNPRELKALHASL
ncbi:thioredoxin family protein [Desulfovibrio sp. UCD-KL4C]|uniref:thioredoxin family protein n=1 Tax=Desulfovibrio sp. UCD-KL4C TaxID=2578120 RepID=UPI0025C1C66D|nr:thioredoxin family protein [Desulfovibrio sp. UCD-KL4C]